MYKKLLRFLNHRFTFLRKLFRLIKFIILGYIWLLLRSVGFKPKFLHPNYGLAGKKYATVALKVFLAPLILAFGVFLFVHPTFAQLSDRQTRMSEVIASGENLEVGIETVDGFSHAYYVFEGEKTYLSEGSMNDKQINTNGEYIVWSKEEGIDSHIFLHNLLSNSVIELSYGGVNINPKVSRTGRVVWESWVVNPDLPAKGNWQLFTYDGKVIRQITQGDLSTHPYIEDDYVVYARKSPDGLWRSAAYSILEDKHTDIDIGNDTEYPRLENGEIYVGPPTESQKKYPLKISDLFLVNLDPLVQGSPSEVTLEGILEELNLSEATVSAEVTTSTDEARLQTP